jgi:hypothetical protein
VTVAGVKLNNNTALTHKAKEKWIPGHESNCGWSETLNLSNFREKYENEEKLH